MSKINRREFLDGSAKATLAIGLPMKNLLAAVPQSDAGQAPPANTAPAVLPGTAPLTMEGDLATQMVDGIRQFLLKRTAEAPKERAGLWHWSSSSARAYDQSVSVNRERFRQIIGAVDVRVPAQAPEPVRAVLDPPEVGQGRGYKVYAVRWPVLAPVIADYGGLDAERFITSARGPPSGANRCGAGRGLDAGDERGDVLGSSG